MENDLLDNEEDGIYTKIICGKKCLHYKINYNGLKFLKDPRFIKWLNEQKELIGKRYKLGMCKSCNFFVYYKDFRGFKCCFSSNHTRVCLYCGNFYAGGSYCCAKTGLIEVSSRYILDGRYTCNIKKRGGALECLKSIPFVFNLVFIGTFYFGIFFHRKIKMGEKDISSYEHRGTKCGNYAAYISFSVILVIAFVYFIPFNIIYFIYLIIFFKGYSKKL